VEGYGKYKRLLSCFVYIKTIYTVMRMLLAVLVVAAVLTSTQGLGSGSEDPVVITSLGALRGSILTSRLGRQIYSFRGVRFAQPPVGNLRFKVKNDSQ
jgi:Carboxylesterase type B